MNGDNRHVDGDDYTWDGGTSNGAPVFNSDAVGDETLAAWAADIGRLAAGTWVALEGLAAHGQAAAAPGTDAAWAAYWQRQGGRAAGTTLEALAELREKFGAYFDAIEDVDAWCAAVRRGDDPPAPDLRTLAERERDDVAALHRRMDALEGIVRAKVQIGQIDAGRLDTLEHELNLLIQRVDGSTRLAQLEATVAALVKVLEVRL